LCNGFRDLADKLLYSSLVSGGIACHTHVGAHIWADGVGAFVFKPLRGSHHILFLLANYAGCLAASNIPSSERLLIR
jgi:hypothetical protein